MKVAEGRAAITGGDGLRARQVIHAAGRTNIERILFCLYESRALELFNRALEKERTGCKRIMD